ncbi:MAG: outer membrane protein transport protein [Bacteroidota bacterium]
MVRLFLSILFSILSLSCCLAGGFQVNLQGQKQSGMGHCGTGLRLDASSMLFNPGAVCFADSISSIYGGASFIVPRTTYLEPFPGTYTANTELHIGTPFTLYAAFRLKNAKNIFIGGGIYTPFGSRNQWPDDWKGQFLIREIELKTVFIQPTVSYRISEKLGIGFGPVFATGGFSLRKAIPVQDTLGFYGEGLLEGKAMGFGFNAGLYFQANERLSMGLDYRSAVSVNVKDGPANFSVPQSLKDYFPSTVFSSRIKLPQVITLGFGYCPNGKLKLALDLNYIGWSSYDTLRIDFRDTTAKLQNIRSARQYKDVFIYRIGAQYKVGKGVWVRMGAYFDTSPAPAGYLTPETPDQHKIGITSGVTLMLSEKFNLDFSFLYIEGIQRTDTNLETQFGGTYKSRAFVPGFALEYQFWPI